MKIIQFFSLTGFLLFFQLFSGFAQESILSKPNIVFIMTDDMGYETIGVNGSTNFKTPVVDRLSAESINFTQL